MPLGRLINQGNETIAPSRHRQDATGFRVVAGESLAQGRNVHLNSILLDCLPGPDAPTTLRRGVEVAGQHRANVILGEELGR